jgi:hypothetical protein
VTGPLVAAKGYAPLPARHAYNALHVSPNTGSFAMIIRPPSCQSIGISRNLAISRAVSSADSMACVGRAFAYDQGELWNRGDGALKIEKKPQGGETTIRLIGHFQSEHIEELKKQLEHGGPRFVLDLTELTLVDVDFVQFLGVCEDGGIEIANCSPYIREWMKQERKV